MFRIIDDLKRSTPQRRQKILERMHEKNVSYFNKTNPELSKFIGARGTGPFRIRITDHTIEIEDPNNGLPFHPPGQLFSYMSELGAPHHSAWVDKLSINHLWRGNTEHANKIQDFLNVIYEDLPLLRERMARGEVSLPTMADGRRYSPPVVFLGIFTGLHIAAYLNRTVVRDLFLIEPDLDRFALSCYFLDYEKIESVCGRLLLHVGPNVPQFPIDQLVTRSPIVASTWVRLLPCYPDGQFDDIINRLSLRWRGLTEIFVPFDRELQNLVYGMQNLILKRPLLTDRPALSSGSVITIVASGPSLQKEIPWLKDNQDKSIICASISCVRVLRENNIRVDFQCTLDTEIDSDLLDKLQLDYSVPLVAYFKINPDIAKLFKTVLLVPEEGKANPVRLIQSFANTHPTTGNLMAAFISWCKPTTLLLIGLDLGYRDPNRSHVEGGWHDDNQGIGHVEETGGRDHLSVTANFAESEGDIVTMSYYNSARIGVEEALKTLDENTKVFNLADGARIEGAAPNRSERIHLPCYQEMHNDLLCIVNAFSTNYSGHLENYETPGSIVIKELLNVIIQAVTVDSKTGFNWKNWSLAVDNAWSSAVITSIKKHRELRIEVFGKLVQDLLSDWYRAMSLTSTPSEATLVYEAGLRSLHSQLDQLEWPDILDSNIDLHNPTSDI